MKKKIYLDLIKPAIDYVFSLVFILLLLPLFLLISLIILLVDGPPVMFKQKRIGRNKKPFMIYKFKTMKNSRGPLLTLDNDARVTQLGKVIRKLKLDELPQLYNILRGEMSFIGSRPEVPILAKEFMKINEAIFELKPGITGLSSIKYIHEDKLLPRSPKKIYKIYQSRILPGKIALDNEYTSKVSFLLDVKIAIRTIYILARALF